MFSSRHACMPHRVHAALRGVGLGLGSRGTSPAASSPAPPLRDPVVVAARTSWLTGCPPSVPFLLPRVLPCTASGPAASRAAALNMDCSSKRARARSSSLMSGSCAENEGDTVKKPGLLGASRSRSIACKHGRLQFRAVTLTLAACMRIPCASGMLQGRNLHAHAH